MNIVMCISIVLVAWLPLSGCAQQFSKEKSTTRDGDKDYRLASGDSALRIPIDEEDGHLFLQVSINDSSPVWFGLDTGATHSLIDFRYAQSLRLKSESSRRIGGAGGYEEASIFKNVSIKLPGADLYNQTLWGLSLDAIASANGRELAGILGYDLFKHFAVDIDYAAKRMSLHEPHAYEYRRRRSDHSAQRAARWRNLRAGKSANARW